MSQYRGYYRYAARGEHSIKRQQQVRYLPGLEIRAAANLQPHMLVITAGLSRIYREGSQIMAHFKLSDRLASVTGVVDVSGKMVSRETWYPYGGTASWLTAAESGAKVKFQRYADKERDATGQ